MDPIRQMSEYTMSIATEGLISFFMPKTSATTQKANTHAAAPAKSGPGDNAKKSEWQKNYNIQVKVHPAGQFTNKDQMLKALYMDAARWLNAIKSSEPLKKKVQSEIEKFSSGGDSLLSDEFEGSNKPTLEKITRTLKIADGVNGKNESMEVCNGSQSITILMSDFVYDMGDIIRYVYQNYLKNVDTGDGDEGHVYYEIREDAFIS